MSRHSCFSTPPNFSTSPNFHGVQLQDEEEEVVLTKAKEDNLLSRTDYSENTNRCIHSPYSEFGAPENLSTPGLLDFVGDQQKPQPSPQSSHFPLGDYLDSCFQAPGEPPQDVSKFSQEWKNPSSSLELLRSHVSKLKLNQLGTSNNSNEICLPENRNRLSAGEIIMLAGARYIQFSDQRCDESHTIINPYGHDLWSLSEEETRDVELAYLLLAAAEKVGYQQFDSARRLLFHCERIASKKINAVQRVIICFVEALQERTNKATGKLTKPNESEVQSLHGLNTDIASMTFHQSVPFSQAIQIAAVQSIVETVGSKRKLHFIDLEIRSGVQWAALMQALAEREQPPLKHINLTAVGRLKDKDKTDSIGNYLERLAKSLNLPFRFKGVYIPSLSDLREDQVHISGDESVVVFSQTILRTMISTPGCLENLMGVIRSLNPTLMVVIEEEANHNSPIFVNRFVEALFTFSTHFDCVETCMADSEECRIVIEEKFFQGIRNIVASEGSERIARSVNITTWRAFFARSKMLEVEFSPTSVYQARLTLERSPCGRFCNLGKSGKTLLFGWKGVPLLSLSAWKFSREIMGRLIVS